MTGQSSCYPGTIDAYSFNAGIEAAAGLCEVPVEPLGGGAIEPAAPVHARWIRQAKLDCDAPAQPQTEPVQDTWFIDRKLPIMAMSGDLESDRVLKLHFRHKVTDADRLRLTEVLNAGETALAAQPSPAADTLKMVADLFSESVHETYTREEVVTIVEDMIRLTRPTPQVSSTDRGGGDA